MSKPIPESMTEFLDGSCKMLREAKEDLVSGGPADLPPLLAWYTHDGDDPLMLPVAQICTEMEMGPVDVLRQILPQARSVMGPPFGVLFVVESFYVFGGGEYPGPGKLAKRFADGDTSVSEALVVVVADRTDMVTRFMPFRYGDGSVIWGEAADTVIRTDLAFTTNTNVPMAIQLAFGDIGAGIN